MKPSNFTKASNPTTPGRTLESILQSTLTAEQAAQERWDAIVIGAGIAGSLAAMGLARLGRRVLLVEKSSLPRSKVCGACLNLDAIAGFQSAGVWDSIAAVGGHELSSYCVRAPGGRQVELELPGGHAVSRQGMDLVLAQHAIDAGAEYMDQTMLAVRPSDGRASVRELSTGDGTQMTASLVVVASGLGASGLGGRASSDKRNVTGHPKVNRQNEVIIESDSRIGLGAQWQLSHPDSSLSRGKIYMAVGDSGYVGLVVTENNTINLAAAIDRSAVQQSSPAEVCQRILKDCDWNFGSALHEVKFHGTPTMTRRRKIAGEHRLFYTGDASGYVEPFTGEGMAWAVRGGMAVVGWSDEAIKHWRDELPEAWTGQLQELLGPQQRYCRWIARLLRHPRLVRHGIGTLSRFPKLGRLAVERIQREHPRNLLDCRVGNSRP